MALPIALVIGSQILGSVFNQMAAQRRHDAAQAARRRETQRSQERTRLAEEARQRSLGRLEADEHKKLQDERTSEVTDILTNPELGPGEIAPALAGAPPTTGPTMVRAAEESARAREEANRTGAGLAAGTALGDIFAGHGIALGQSAQDIGSQGVAARDSARVMQDFEIPVAMERGQGLDFLGNMARTAGAVGAGYAAVTPPPGPELLKTPIVEPATGQMQWFLPATPRKVF